MKKLNIDLEYCYGINKFKETFSFEKKNKNIDTHNCIAIYASNGIMKSSFANTFNDLKNDVETKDRIFSDRKTNRSICDETGNTINSNQVYVISPELTPNVTKSVVALLSDNDSRQRYDDIHEKINEIKQEFLNELSMLSGLSTTKTESEICECFHGEFVKVLEQIKLDMVNSDTKFTTINYSTIFNDKMKQILQKPNVLEELKHYLEKYKLLIDKSKYLKLDFDFQNADDVHKNLKKNKFFDANHSINLFDKASETTVKVSDDRGLKSKFDDELKKILEEKDMEKIWKKIDSEFKTKGAKEYRNYLESHKDILLELNNLKEFSRKLWRSYCIKHKTLFDRLLSEYRSADSKIKKIQDDIINKKNKWREIIDMYNDRFDVPFNVVIANHHDVVFDNELPKFEFIYHDLNKQNSISVEKTTLENYLSTGEKQALYVLDILYEIQALKENKQETLIIVDDVIDSFDYVHKYALMHYLREISKFESFYMIIMTHNYDFLKTIIDIGIVSKTNCYFAYKIPHTIFNSEIKLELCYGLLSNPLHNYSNDLSKLKNIIIMIPLLRNILEYTMSKDDSDYESLSQMLHYDPENKLMLNNLKDICDRRFKNSLAIDKFPDIDGSINEIILSECEKCLDNGKSGFNLDNKIILSIGIRLLAEKYIYEKDNSIVLSKYKSLGMLYSYYKKHHADDQNGLKLLDAACIMSSSNIHLNSFMFEPIMDTSINYLISLYTKLCDTVCG